MKKIVIIVFALAVSLYMAFCENTNDFSVNSVPKFGDSPYVVINKNIAEFDESELTTKSYEEYKGLDYLGRCRSVKACVSKEMMPEDERCDISYIKPSGWHSIKADDVEDGWLYNRCHLYMRAIGGDDSKTNMITGTRYLNVEGMLPFETEVFDYVSKTDNHVMYCVEPVYENFNLICSGVHMMAYSVEDEGKGINFNVYCYNVQPNHEINYLTGNER